MNPINTFLLTFSLLIIGFRLSAQQEGCGTIATPEDIAYLQSLQDQIDAYTHDYLEKAIIDIPVQAHIIRRNDGTGGLSIQDWDAALDALNEVYAPVEFNFYDCAPPNLIDSDDFFDYNRMEESDMVALYQVEDVINVYIPGGELIGSDGGALCGYAVFPGSSRDLILMSRSCMTNGSTFSHEMGHYFGLYHSHGTSNCGSLTDELVNGSNCSTAGDRVCDTPADPNLQGVDCDAYLVNLACEYTGDLTDANGDLFVPNPRNLMSYSRKECRDFLSSGQFDRVSFFQANGREYLTCASSNCPPPTDVILTSVSYSHFRFDWDNSTITTANIQYRIIGDPTWIFLEDYSGGAHISLNKIPCTDYEWQIQGVCDGVIGDWSDSYFVTTTGCDDPYCYAYGRSFDNWIERVAVAEIDNSSGNDYGYANYTDQVAELLGGLTYSITLDPDANGTGAGADVFWIGWIDYNGDDDFNDPGEEIFTTTSGSQDPINVSFTVPNTLNNGFSRMRIAMSVDGTPDLCQIGGNGDVEDYGLYIESALSELSVNPINVFFDATGGTEDVTVSSNIDWTVTESAPWFSVSPMSGSGDGSFMITCDPNPGTTSRTATITITGGGLTRTVTVEQAGVAPILTVTPTNVFFNAPGGTEDVTVSSNIDWTVTESAPWFSVSPMSGSGDGSFTITCDPNPGTTNRTATITITGGGLTRTVTVEQAGLTPMLTVTPANVFFDAPGGTEEVTVSSNIDWTITESAPWFSVSPLSGSGDGSFTITCDPNPGTTNRTATITITGGGLTRTVTVEQAGLTPMLTVTPANVFFNAPGGTEDVTVSSNIDWTVTESAPWFSVSPMSGSGDGSFTITCDPNPGTTSRTATITITGGGLTRTVTVEQAGLTPMLTVTPANVFFDAPGGTEEVTVSSNIDWTITESAPWLSVSPLSGSGDGSFFIDCDPNPGTTSRTATITITGGGITIIVTVEQAGTEPFLFVNPETVFFDATGGSEEVTVNSNIDWTVTENTPWFSVSPTSGSGNDSFIIDCDPNPSTNSRTATITITGGGLTRTVTVEQAGVTPILLVSPPLVLFDAIGGMEDVTVSSNIDWTVTESSSWFSVSPTNGSSDGSFTIICMPNPGTSTRIGTITITGGGITRTVTVQQGGTAPFLLVNPETVFFAASGGNQNVMVSSNVNWSVSENASWFNINPANGSGNGSFTITCQFNPDPQGRTATITITGGGITRTIIVEQAGNSIELTVDPQLVFFNAPGGTEEVTVSSNTAWTVSENAPWFSVSPMNGNGNGSFIIDCMPNMTAQTRTATITITGGGETVTVVVEQLGEAVSLSVTPENVFFEAAGGTETALVSSNVSWTASDNATWLTLNPSSGTGNGNFTITCQPYTGTQPRTATITVTGGGITRTITVEQAGIQPFLSANPTTVFFAATGGMNEVIVNSNLNWTVSEGATWLTLSPQTGNGIGSFVINCAPNPGTQIRNALITLSGGGLERIIEVGQAGAVPYLTVNQDFIYFNPPGGSGEIELSSNIGWIVTSSETWASITPVSGNGNASLYVDCLVNNNPDPREAVFTIIGGGINTSFTLEQLGTSIFCQDSETTIDTMLCAGQSITIGNNTYTETGSYENLFQTPDGCDSLITLDLEVFDIAQLLPSELTTCPGQPATILVPAGYEIGLMGVPSGNTLSLNVGTYEVTIADDLFACTATQTVTVVEEGLGVAITGQATICANEPHPLQATPAATYLWSTNETTATINVSAPGTYCVTATDASGCEGNSCFEVTEDLTFPSFSDCPEDQLVTVDPGETAAAIDWIPPFATDNCGNDPLVVQSSHEPGSIFNVGTTAVSYTVTDANGNATTCTFSVTVQTTPTEDLTFYIDTTGFTRSGDTICVPVRVLNFTEVAAFQFSLAAPDEMQSSLITIDAVAPLTNIDGVGGLFYQEETPNLGQLLWLNPTGDGLTLADSTAIFQIKMFVDTPAGECVPLALTGVPLAPEAFVIGEGAVIPDLLNGSICVNNLIDIIGETYKITNEPINLTEVSLISVDTTQMDTTDVAGRYDFNQVLAAIDYTILPARDFGDVEGLSVLDMIGILRHIQGRTIITNPYILLAADVNLTGSITIADILEVRELILNNVQAFPNTTSWFFVPVAYEFPDTLNPWLEPVPDRVELIAPTDDQDIDFYGIKSGDINLSNNGQNLTTGTLSLAFAEQAFSAGVTIDVPVYAANLAAISGFQLGLNIDPGYLQILEVLPGTTALDAGALTFGVHDREEGELPIVFLREQPQAGTVSDGPLFTLRLAARAAGRLSEVLQLDNRILTQQAFDDDLQTYAIELTTTALTNTLELQQAVARLVQVQPNPFREQLQLDFYFPKSTDLKVELLDVQGRVHYFSAMQTNTGRNRVTIAPEQSLSNGIYFCRWQTADASGVVKVVKE